LLKKPNYLSALSVNLGYANICFILYRNFKSILLMFVLETLDLIEWLDRDVKSPYINNVYLSKDDQYFYTLTKYVYKMHSAYQNEIALNRLLVFY